MMLRAVCGVTSRHSLSCHPCFGGIVAGCPEASIGKSVGEILLLHEIAGVIMRILIAGSISEVGHQLCRRVSKVERHGQVAGAVHGRFSIVDSHVC